MDTWCGNGTGDGRKVLRTILLLVMMCSLWSFPAKAAGLVSQFLGADPEAVLVMSGTPYDMNDPAWLVNASDQNKNTFAYKLFSALLMLGYQTEIAINGLSAQIPHLLALKAFQSSNALPQTNLVDAECLGKIDQLLASREQELAPHAQGFQLYNHMQPLHPNDISKDALAAIYSLPMKALPGYLQMSLYEEVQCINSQCNGFIQDPDGNNFTHFPIALSEEYRFVGAYFDPLLATPRKPSAAVHVQTVLHEYAHYLDGFYKVFPNDPQITKFKIIDTTGFYHIGYNLANSPKNGCYVPRSSDPYDWISAYAAQMPWDGAHYCPANSSEFNEDWAESFSMYVASGRDFRAAAARSGYLAQRYNWLKENVFDGLEYDTDLVRDLESGCNDVYHYGLSGVPGYAHCNNNYIWDFTLKPLASTVVKTPSAPAPGAFAPQSGFEPLTVVISNSVTVSGINWPAAVSVSGGEYSVNGGTYISTSGVVSNRDTVTLRQTASSSYSARSDAVLTIGGVSSVFSVTTRTPLQPAISGTPAPEATTGVPYSFTPTATNAITFTIDRTPPSGITFNPLTGVLSGIPDIPGVFGPFVISAVNGNLSASLPAFSIRVSSPVGTFSGTGSLETGRYQHTATLLPTGKVLVAGGYDYLDQPLASAELYDPLTGTWSPAAPMLSVHAGHSATLLQDGRVLVTGGAVDELTYTPLAVAEIYDPVANSWTATPAMKYARNSHTATLLPDGRVLAVGGVAMGSDLTTCELFDPDGNIWVKGGQTPAPFIFHVATALADGRVLISGGYDSEYMPSQLAAIYDPALSSWSPAAPMQQARVNHSATLLGDGSVLAAGGYGSGILAGVERYYPQSNIWVAAAPLSSPRYFHTATLLRGGGVLVAGGQGETGILAGGEVFEPASGRWTPSGRMAFAQGYYGAVQLTDGRVLLTGGNSSTYATSAAQIFDAGTVPDYTVRFTSDSNGLLGGVTIQKVTQGGNTTTVSALPAPGYQFAGWIGSGGWTPTAVNPLVIRNVTSDLDISATFTPSLVTLDPVLAPYPVILSGTCAAGATVMIMDASGSFGKVKQTGTLWKADLTLMQYDPSSLTVRAVDGSGKISLVKVVLPLPDGDVDGDGQVTVLDGLKLIRAVLSGQPPDPQMLAHGDIGPLRNGLRHPDGKLEVVDGILILRKALGLEPW